MSLDHLGTDPLPDDADELVATQFLEYLDSLLDGDDLAFALDTLTGIRSTVAKTRRVTENQRNAVNNIIAGARRRERDHVAGTRSRRYEGFSR